MTMRTEQIWVYREPERVSPSQPITGYGVEAADGSIGKIDEATYDVGSSYLVIDTGPWIFGKKVMLPAGIVERVDHDDRMVFVFVSKDEIKNAPEFDETAYRGNQYRNELGTYYEPFYERDNAAARMR